MNNTVIKRFKPSVPLTKQQDFPNFYCTHRFSLIPVVHEQIFSEKRYVILGRKKIATYWLLLDMKQDHIAETTYSLLLACSIFPLFKVMSPRNSLALSVYRAENSFWIYVLIMLLSILVFDRLL